VLDTQRRDRFLVLAVLVLIVSLAGALHSIRADEPVPSVDVPWPAVDRNGHIEHRYQVVGRIRLLLFWAGAANVGGARLSLRSDRQARSVSLLIGSDPQRAPRGINEWGYIRESVDDDVTSVFAIRPKTGRESPQEAAAARTRADSMAKFEVLCSTVTAMDAISRTAAVGVSRAATYENVDQVLDAVDGARWDTHRVSRPPDVAPGFLTALDTMLHSSSTAVQAHQRTTWPQSSYVYKDTVYDFIPRRLEHVEQLQTVSGVFRNLLRTDVVLRNRKTGSLDNFSIAYGIDAPLAGVPVFVRYQPNWWFKVELVLDDNQQVPADPEDEAIMQRRIAATCSPH
jgi:hypothetical protein